MKSYRQVLQTRVPAGQRKTRDLVFFYGVHTLSALIQKLEPVPASPPVPVPVPPPVIDSVAKNPASGTFEVRGHDFRKNHAVHIRVTNTKTLAGDFFLAHSGADGSIDALLPIPPQLPGTQLAFSANDERTVPPAIDITGILWSNTVTVPA